MHGFFSAREHTMTFKTPDLCDEFEAELGKTVRAVAPMFQRYGRRNSFSGEIVTLSTAVFLFTVSSSDSVS